MLALNNYVIGVFLFLISQLTPPERFASESSPTSDIYEIPESLSDSDLESQGVEQSSFILPSWSVRKTSSRPMNGVQFPSAVCNTLAQASLTTHYSDAIIEKETDSLANSLHGRENCDAIDVDDNLPRPDDYSLHHELELNTIQPTYLREELSFSDNDSDAEVCSGSNDSASQSSRPSSGLSTVTVTLNPDYDPRASNSLSQPLNTLKNTNVCLH